MKNQTLTQAPPAAAATRKARRTKAKPMPVPAKVSARGDSLQDALAEVRAAPGTSALQGSIQLDLSTMGPAVLLTEVRKISTGLTGNLFYPNLPETVRTGLTAAEAGLLLCSDNLAAAEQYLRTCRAAQQIEVGNARNALRTAATACETEDRSDEALVSAGWNIRRPAGRPKPVPAPRGITLKNNPIEGEVEAQWPRVGNAHYYEVKSMVSIAEPDPAIWDTIPTFPSSPARNLFKGLPVAQYLCVRVRAVGAKGPSAWSEAATIRIN